MAAHSDGDDEPGSYLDCKSESTSLHHEKEKKETLSSDISQETDSYKKGISDMMSQFCQLQLNSPQKHLTTNLKMQNYQWKFVQKSAEFMDFITEELQKLDCTIHHVSASDNVIEIDFKQSNSTDDQPSLHAISDIFDRISKKVAFRTIQYNPSLISFETFVAKFEHSLDSSKAIAVKGPQTIMVVAKENDIDTVCDEANKTLQLLTDHKSNLCKTGQRGVTESGSNVSQNKNLPVTIIKLEKKQCLFLKKCEKALHYVTQQLQSLVEDCEVNVEVGCLSFVYVDEHDIEKLKNKLSELIVTFKLEPGLYRDVFSIQELDQLLRERLCSECDMFMVSKEETSHDVIVLCTDSVHAAVKSEIKTITDGITEDELVMPMKEQQYVKISGRWNELYNMRDSDLQQKVYFEEITDGETFTLKIIGTRNKVRNIKTKVKQWLEQQTYSRTYLLSAIKVKLLRKREKAQQYIQQELENIHAEFHLQNGENSVTLTSNTFEHLEQGFKKFEKLICEECKCLKQYLTNQILTLNEIKNKLESTFPEKLLIECFPDSKQLLLCGTDDIMQKVMEMLNEITDVCCFQKTLVMDKFRGVSFHTEIHKMIDNLHDQIESCRVSMEEDNDKYVFYLIGPRCDILNNEEKIDNFFHSLDKLRFVEYIDIPDSVCQLLKQNEHAKDYVRENLSSSIEFDFEKKLIKSTTEVKSHSKMKSLFDSLFRSDILLLENELIHLRDVNELTDVLTDILNDVYKLEKYKGKFLISCPTADRLHICATSDTFDDCLSTIKEICKYTDQTELGPITEMEFLKQKLDHLKSDLPQQVRILLKTDSDLLRIIILGPKAEIEKAKSQLNVDALECEPKQEIKVVKLSSLKVRFLKSKDTALNYILKTLESKQTKCQFDPEKGIIIFTECKCAEEPEQMLDEIIVEQEQNISEKPIKKVLGLSKIAERIEEKFGERKLLVIPNDNKNSLQFIGTHDVMPNVMDKINKYLNSYEEKKIEFSPGIYQQVKNSEEFKDISATYGEDALIIKPFTNEPKTGFVIIGIREICASVCHKMENLFITIPLSPLKLKYCQKFTNIIDEKFKENQIQYWFDFDRGVIVHNEETEKQKAKTLLDEIISEHCENISAKPIMKLLGIEKAVEKIKNKLRDEKVLLSCHNEDLLVVGNRNIMTSVLEKIHKMMNNYEERKVILWNTARSFYDILQISKEYGENTVTIEPASCYESKAEFTVFGEKDICAEVCKRLEKLVKTVKISSSRFDFLKGSSEAQNLVSEKLMELNIIHAFDFKEENVLHVEGDKVKQAEKVVEEVILEHHEKMSSQPVTKLLGLEKTATNIQDKFEKEKLLVIPNQSKNELLFVGSVKSLPIILKQINNYFTYFEEKKIVIEKSILDKIEEKLSRQYDSETLLVKQITGGEDTGYEIVGLKPYAAEVYNKIEKLKAEITVTSPENSSFSQNENGDCEGSVLLSLEKIDYLNKFSSEEMQAIQIKYKTKINASTHNKQMLVVKGQNMDAVHSTVEAIKNMSKQLYTDDLPLDEDSFNFYSTNNGMKIIRDEEKTNNCMITVVDGWQPDEVDCWTMNSVKKDDPVTLSVMSGDIISIKELFDSGNGSVCVFPVMYEFTQQIPSPAVTSKDDLSQQFKKSLKQKGKVLHYSNNIVFQNVFSSKKSIDNGKESITELLTQLNKNKKVTVVLFDMSYEDILESHLAELIMMGIRDFVSSHNKAVSITKIFLVTERKEKALQLTNMINDTFVLQKKSSSFSSKNKFLRKKKSEEKDAVTSYISKIDIHFGELAKQKVDVLVNSTNTDLYLNQGMISKSLLESAGDQIQKECKEKYNSRIQEGEVAITGPGRLSGVKAIFHGALPEYDKKTHKMTKFILECLSLCEKNHYKTIAFPTLGTGNLNYPPEIVVTTMMNAVEKHFTEKKDSTIEKVGIVIYDDPSNNTIKKIFLSNYMQQSYGAEKGRIFTFNGIDIQLILGNISQCAGKSESILCFWQCKDLSEPSKHPLMRHEDIQAIKLSECISALKKDGCVRTSAHSLPASRMLIHCLIKQYTTNDLKDAIKKSLKTAEYQHLHSLQMPITAYGLLARNAEVVCSALVKYLNDSEIKKICLITLPVHNKKDYEDFAKILHENSQSILSKFLTFTGFGSNQVIDHDEGNVGILKITSNSSEKNEKTKQNLISQFEKNQENMDVESSVDAERADDRKSQDTEETEDFNHQADINPTIQAHDHLLEKLQTLDGVKVMKCQKSNPQTFTVKAKTFTHLIDVYKIINSFQNSEPDIDHLSHRLSNQMGEGARPKQPQQHSPSKMIPNQFQEIIIDSCHYEAVKKIIKNHLLEKCCITEIVNDKVKLSFQISSNPDESKQLYHQIEGMIRFEIDISPSESEKAKEAENKLGEEFSDVFCKYCCDKLVIIGDNRDTTDEAKTKANIYLNKIKPTKRSKRQFSANTKDANESSASLSASLSAASKVKAGNETVIQQNTKQLSPKSDISTVSTKNRPDVRFNESLKKSNNSPETTTTSVKVPDILIYCDNILHSNAQAIVCWHDTDLSEKHSVPNNISEAAGEEYRNALKAYSVNQFSIGHIFKTTEGKLQKMVIHALVSLKSDLKEISNLKEIISKIFAFANSQELSSVAFPVLMTQKDVCLKDYSKMIFQAVEEFAAKESNLFLKQVQIVDKNQIHVKTMQDNYEQFKKLHFSNALSKPESRENKNVCSSCKQQDSSLAVFQKCKHLLCQTCRNKFSSVCPVCSSVSKPVWRSMPKGQMSLNIRGFHLEGYPHDGTIVINYSFTGGTQSEGHPNPGKEYYSTTKTAYLPNNEEGRTVYKLLKIAFDRGLTFIIGADNFIKWSDIEHKTNTWGGPEYYGYPDPDYLKRVREQLARKGITDGTSV